MRTETRAPLRSMSLDPLGRRGGRIGGSDLTDPCIRLLHAPERPLPMRRWRPFRHKRSNRGGGAGAGTKPQGMGLVPSATPDLASTKIFAPAPCCGVRVVLSVRSKLAPLGFIQPLDRPSRNSRPRVSSGCTRSSTTGIGCRSTSVPAVCASTR